MKNQVNPAVVAVILIVVVGIAAFFLFKQTGSPGDVAPGGVGHAGPFSPGGSAVGKGGGAPAAASRPQSFHP